MRIRGKGFGLLLSLTMVIAFLFTNFAAAKNAQTDYAAGEVIVKYKAGKNADRIAKRHDGKVLEKMSKQRLSKMNLSDDVNIKKEISKLKNDSEIEYAEPNYVVKAKMMPNDTEFYKQWAIPRMKVDKAWDITPGNSSIVIAIVDTGVDSDHPDLKDNLVPGYNAITGTTNTNDDNGHGTHVAGIAAASFNNARGVSGVSGFSKIMPIKALGSNGSGYLSDVAEGVIWAADHGAKVINMSLGGPYYSQTLQDAIDYAYSKGAIIIVAAGNDNSSAPAYPAGNNHVVAISATNEADGKAWFSNYGSNIDLAAPGTNIYSSTFDGAYGYKQGTSMATPYVTGVAALVWSARPELTNAQLENILESTATDLGTTGKDNYFGYGLVNAFAAMPTKVDQTPISINLYGASPDPFGKTTRIIYSFKGNGLLTLKIYDSQGELVRTIFNKIGRKTGTYYTTWTGKDFTGAPVPSGVYTYVLEGEDYAGNKIKPLSGTVTVDHTPPVITNVSNSDNPFSPAGNNINSVSYNLSEDAKVTVKIYNSKNTLIRTLASSTSQDAQDNSLEWDGKDKSGNLVKDGVYTVKINAVDAYGNKAAEQKQTVRVERDAPVISEVWDSPDPIKGDGIESTIKFTLSESSTVTLNIYDKNNALVRALINKIVLSDTNSVVWNTKNDKGDIVSDGLYTYKINATDASGKIATEATGTINIDKTAPIISNVKLSPQPYNQTAGSLYITYDLSEKADVTITIIDSANVVAATLENNTYKNAGANAVIWDGKDVGGKTVADGAYSYKITAKDDSGNVTAVSGKFSAEGNIPEIFDVIDHDDPYDSTGTLQHVIEFKATEPVMVGIKVYDSNGKLVRTLIDNYPDIDKKPLGGIAVGWDASNDTRVKLPDGIYTYKINAVDLSGKVAKEVTGTVTVDTTPFTALNLSVSPEIFDIRTQNEAKITYKLQKKANVTVGIYDISNNLVRTIQQNILKDAGTIIDSWDGKDSKGNKVVDGIYTIKVTTVDLAGHSLAESASVVVDSGPGVIKADEDFPDPYTPNTIGSNPWLVYFTISEQMKEITFALYDPQGKDLGSSRGEFYKYPGKSGFGWTGLNSWDLKPAQGGVYSYKIYGYDMAGNPSNVVNGTVTVVNGTGANPGTPPVISDIKAFPNPFGSNNRSFVSIFYKLSEKSYITVKIYDSVGKLVKVVENNISKDSGNNSSDWDVKDSDGNMVDDGTYYYEITARNMAGASATATGSIVVDRAVPAISGVIAAPDPFRPDGKEICNIYYTLSENANVSLNIYNASGKLVKTLLQNYAAFKGKNVVGWTGDDIYKILVDDGTYTYKITATDSSGNVSRVASATIVVDKSNPKITNISSTPYPFAPTGTNKATISYTLSEKAYITTRILDASDTVVAEIETNEIKNSGANSVVWNGKDLSGSIVKDGKYKIEITAVDMAKYMARAFGEIAVDGAKPVISNVNVQPNVINPTAKNNANISFSISESATGTVKIYDSSSKLIKTINFNEKTEVSTSWNGTDTLGVLAADGKYTYKINASDAFGKAANEVLGTITMDRTAPVIGQVKVTPYPFAPTGNNNATISFNISEKVYVAVTIYDNKDKVIKILENNILKNAGVVSTTWDGKDSSGNIVNDAIYKYEITAADEAGSVGKAAGGIAIEAQDPVISEVSDTPDPFKVDGTKVNKITFVTSENTDGIVKIYSNQGKLVKTSNFTQIQNGKFEWDGTDEIGQRVPDGIYTYKINAQDAFGKAAKEAEGTITVDTKAAVTSQISVNPYPFAPNGSNNVTISYNLSEKSDVSIKILDGLNNVIRILKDKVSKGSGQNSVVWDGKDKVGNIVSDDIYKAEITAVDQVGFESKELVNVAVETGAPVISDVSDTPDPFIPDGTKTAAIAFKVSEKAAGTVKIYNSKGSVVKTFDFNQSGKLEFKWDGKDDNGFMVQDGIYTYKINAQDTFGKAAKEEAGTINVDTTAPVITGDFLTPFPFAPKGSNTATLSYSISEKAKVTIAIYDSFGDLIKVIQKDAEKESGLNLATWDGKDEAGNIVPDNTYTYEITAVDGAGLIGTLSGSFMVDGQVPVISDVYDDPDPFKPGGINNIYFHFKISEPSDGTIKNYDPAGNLIAQAFFYHDTEYLVSWSAYQYVSGKWEMVPDGVYTYKINATDAFGKAAKEVVGTFVIDKTAPSITDVEFTPNIGDPSGRLTYTISEEAKVTTAIYDSSNNLVAELETGAQKAAGTYTVNWDGKNKSGVKVGYGIYTYKITAQDLVSSEAEPVTGIITLETIEHEDPDTSDETDTTSTKNQDSQSGAKETPVVDKTPPVISGVSASPSVFQTSGTISYTLSENSKVTLAIYNSSNILVRLLEDNALKFDGSYKVNWDGKYATGVQVEDGIYTYRITAVDMAGLSAVPMSGTITLDGSGPVISSVIDSPDVFGLNGTRVNVIRYTISEAAAVTINIYDKNGFLIRILLNGNVAKGTNEAAWDGKSSLGTLVADGTYTYRINSKDIYGKVGEEKTGTIATDKTLPTVSGATLMPKIFGPKGIIYYTLSEIGKVTITIYDSSNNIVKVLEDNVAKSAGPNSVVWDGSNSTGATAANGNYTFKITATDQAGFTSEPLTGTVTVDATPITITNLNTSPKPYNPRGSAGGQAPATISYTLSANAKVTIEVYTANNTLVKTVVADLYQKAGLNYIMWYGADSTNKTVSSGTYTYKITAVSDSGVQAQATGTIDVQ